MMKIFKPHPLMIFYFVKPTLIALILPAIQAILQYLTHNNVNGVRGFWLSIIGAIFGIAVLRWRSYKLICNQHEQVITIEYGFFFKRITKINITKLSSVQTVQNPVDFIFGAVTIKINTEAGIHTRADFKFKLGTNKSRELALLLYGEEKAQPIKYSAIKVAVLVATASSAFTGMLVAVPILNRAGNLLGIGVGDMLLDGINSISAKIESYFPPILNTISLIILFFFLVSFTYSFFKYVNFRLFLEKDKLCVWMGAIVKTRTVFRKSAINNIKVEQTIIMKTLKRYALKVSVGGYGNAKGESEVIIPLGTKNEIRNKLKKHFPFFVRSGTQISPKRNYLTQSRFLFLPALYFIGVTALSIWSVFYFEYLTRFVVFLNFVFCTIIILYAYIGLFEYHYSQISFGDNFFARSSKGLRTLEINCPKENVGEIKITLFPPDRWYKTCRVRVLVHGERADNIRVRHIDYETVKAEIYKCFNIE